MKIKWPTLKRRNKEKEKKNKKYDSEIDFAVTTVGAMTVAGTLIIFPEPLISTTAGFIVAVATGAYHYSKAKRSKAKTQVEKAYSISIEDVYLEILKIKLGVYVTLGVMFVWGASVISLKLLRLLFEVSGALPKYVRVSWALVVGVLVFIW